MNPPPQPPPPPTRQRPSGQQRAAATRATLRRRLIAAGTEHLPLKIAALFFSLVLWLVVSAEGPAEQWSPIRLVLNRDSAVRVVGDLPDIEGLMVGRGRELFKLYGSPAVIRRTITADMPETLSFELRPADVDMPSNIDAQVRDVRPHRITLHFDIATQRRVPVRAMLHVTADSGFRVTGPPRIEPESVRVMGSRSAVRAVTAVPTVATEIRVHDTTAVVVPLDTSGLHATVLPAAVRVRVPIARVAPPPPEPPAAGRRPAGRAPRG